MFEGLNRLLGSRNLMLSVCLKYHQGSVSINAFSCESGAEFYDSCGGLKLLANFIH